MQVQKYILKEPECFNLKDIFTCGQCFRWNAKDDGSYTGVIKNGVINVKKINNDVIFEGICNGNIADICRDYFDLNRDYNKIKTILSNVDEYLKESIEYGAGIRILNQDLWEMIISFIISANNNIPRIKGIIEKMSQKYGNKIVWKGKDYYIFPTIKQLSSASKDDLRALGMGFRDTYIFNTTNTIASGDINLEELHNEKDTSKVREKLLTLSGVGPKVADCILLFSTLKRFDVFPIDVWVRRVMNDLYIKNEDETKVSKKEIEKLAKEKYGDLEGIAQQYLFYWRREQ